MLSLTARSAAAAFRPRRPPLAYSKQLQLQLQPTRVQARTFAWRPADGSSLARRSLTYAKWTGYLCISTVVGLATLTAGIFVHDAFTYTDKHLEGVPVSPLALNPERGGPKNLPIARVQVDDEEDEENKKLAEKPKLVIVGGGWGVSSSTIIHEVAEAQWKSL
jgi:hypothetical protein